ncbi:hypothetical protein AX17_000122 [Amanita inopinata Kibby_2008]|nr:hypothetical protein AX17_000122 [Amanita inopinata Kibby_2008]
MHPRNAAYVTLLTKQSYLTAALVVDYGLRAVKSKYPLVAMVTSSLPEDARIVLQRRGIVVREVETLKPQAVAHQLHPHDARFEDTWTKLRGFELEEYERVVLLDCDMLVRKNMDELFEIELPEDEIAAAHVCACNPRKLAHYPADWIPENCAHAAVTHPTALPPPVTETSPRPYTQLNSGLVVLNPSKEIASAIYDFLDTSSEVASFAFPDQDLLTAYFEGKWRPIHWYYNALKTLRDIHPNEWSDDEVRCVHYILPDKPWHRRVIAPELEEKYGILNSWWWEQFDKLGEEMKAADAEMWSSIESDVDTLH